MWGWQGCVCVCVSIWVSLYVMWRLYVCLCVYVYSVCTCVCVYMWYVCAYVCVFLCVCMSVCVHMYLSLCGVRVCWGECISTGGPACQDLLGSRSNLRMCSQGSCLGGPSTHALLTLASLVAGHYHTTSCNQDTLSWADCPPQLGALPQARINPASPAGSALGPGNPSPCSFAAPRGLSSPSASPSHQSPEQVLRPLGY